MSVVKGHSRSRSAHLPLVIEVGGSTRFKGGAEAICDRARAALWQQGRWRVRQLRADTAYLSVAQLPALLRGLARFVVLARRDRPKCVWIHYANMADLLYVVIARGIGQRVLVTPHVGTHWRSRTNPILRSLSHMMLRAAHRFALPTTTVEIDLAPPRGIPRSLIRTSLPSGIVNTPFVEPIAAPDRLHLLHASRLSAEKGTFLFLDMCELLRDRGVPFVATLAGGAEAATLGEVKRRIETAGLSEHVSYLGMLSEPEMIEAMHAADLLVHLSRQDSYPLTVLEALGCGAIPMCYDLAGARQMVETYGGMCFGDGDIAQEAARWVSEQSPEALRALGKRLALRIREDYSWPRCAQSISAALDAVTKNSTIHRSLAP